MTRSLRRRSSQAGSSAGHPAEHTVGATRSRPHRLARRILGGLIALTLVAVLASVGSWAYATRAQGQPQAVEFADAHISPAMTNARVLALGEATHGNAEFQELRTTVLSKVVGHGFRTVVLEEDYGCTHEVNAFVQGGPGTAQEAAQRFGFRINKTTQVAAWLQWMRDHNAAVPPAERIQLVGMDVQRTEASLRLLSAALTKTDPALAAKATAEGDGIARETIAALGEAVAHLPVERRHDAAIAVTSLGHFRDLEDAGPAYAKVRDRAMFSHLRRIVGEVTAAHHGGVLVIAHDGHVAKSPTGALTETVGHLAAQEWGEGYRVIGTDFVHTRFLSGSGDDRREWSLTNRTPLRGMYDGTNVGYLEVAQTTGENRALFDGVQPMGNAGEGFTRMQQLLPFLHTVYAAPAQLYDAVILVDHATPVTML